MTRLWIFSDLHQDSSANSWDPLPHAPADGFDVVVAVGDVHSPLTTSVDWLADRFPGTRVLYVPGNHDFWWWPNDADDRFSHDGMLARGRDLAARRGIDLLSDDTVVIDGTRFVGSTLWTDLRLGTRSLGHALGSTRRGMNDYSRIRRRPSGPHRQLRPTDTMVMHGASRAYIDATLAAPFDGPSVVLTHHAPHPDSLPDRHADLRWAYASDLSASIGAGRPNLWVHGHIHASLDYVVGDTRIVANPRGHRGEPSRQTFDPSLVITV